MGPRERIINKISDVTPLPTASSEVIRLVRDPDVPTAKLARVIEYDPSLTANVLRLANSAYFGFPQSVSTVKDALFRLGTNSVFQMIVTSTVGKMSQKPVRGYDLSGGELWDHLIGTAIGATRLATALKIEVPDHTFTAALMHDIGKIVLGTFVEADGEEIIALALEKNVSFEQAEQEVLGIDHAEVGARLVEHWNLPSYLVDVVRWHHEPEGIPGDSLVGNLVHVADVSCLMAGVGAGLDALNYRPSVVATEQLGLQMNILDQIIYDILNELMEVRTLFKFD